MSFKNVNTVFIDEISRLSKAILGSDENSRKALFGMVKLISAGFSGLPLESKMPILNMFVNAFFKFNNKMASLNQTDTLELMQTSISMLTSFATNSEPITQLHELVFYDLTAKLFSLLCKLVETCKQVPKNKSGSLLTTKAYIFSGLPGYVLKMPDDVVSFHGVPKEAGPGVGGGNRLKKVRSLTLDPLLASLENLRLGGSSLPSSESSLSEKSALVRRNALNFLCVLLQYTTPSSVITAWPVLLSTPSTATNWSSSNSQESWFVLSMMLHDQSMLVRYMACSVVIELLDEGVKPFLAAAQDSSIGAQSSTSTSSGSFTPYSVQLASHIREVHRCLIAAALHANNSSSQEKCPQMVVHVLKALASLVRITPYHRLKPGLLSDVFKVSSSLLRSKDVDVRVACLTVFGEILTNSNAHPLFEMECLVRSCKPPAFSRPLSYCNSPTGSISGTDTPLLEQQGAGFQPWLLKIALESAAPNSVYSYPVKIEALQLLNAMVKFYAKTLFFEAKQLPELFKFIYAAMYAADPVYLAHVCFVLETIGNQLNEVNDQQQLPLNEIVLFWSDILSNHVFRLLQVPSSSTAGQQQQSGATLGAALFDVISSIGPFVFDRLPANLRILCTTTPMDFCNANNVDKSLSSAAIRCLGHLVSYKSMQKDRGFVQSCVEISLRHVKSEPACQCAVAWLLRNALDCDLDLIATIPYDLVLLASINLTLKGPDKAKPHSMSVIWQILLSGKVANSQELTSLAVGQVVCPVLNGQVKGPVKLQWNAADGLLEAVSSEKSLTAIETYLPQLVDASCSAMVSSANFRTRTTLANALRQFALVGNAAANNKFGRQCLDAYFNAFSSAHENIKNPSEFKHVGPLVVALWHGFVTWLATKFDNDAGWLGEIGVDRLENVVRDVKTSLTSGNVKIDQPLVNKAVERLQNHQHRECAKILLEAVNSTNSNQQQQ